MQVLDEQTKFAHLGKPGTGFSKGFARRLKIISQLVDLQHKRILDNGCGEGVWLEQFLTFTVPENIFGCDIDPENIELIRQRSLQAAFPIPAENLAVSPGEKLPYPAKTFDIIFSNEVIEHVQDDRKCVEEMVRVLNSGGKAIIFTPNRGWPFEQHGMFWRGKYYWGNIPLLPWMPKFVRQKFAPHVRNYSNSELRRLFDDLPVKIVYHKHLFSGFDGLVRGYGVFGKLIQQSFHALEKTPFHFFGISHLLIIEKK